MNCDVQRAAWPVLWASNVGSRLLCASTALVTVKLCGYRPRRHNNKNVALGQPQNRPVIIDTGIGV